MHFRAAVKETASANRMAHKRSRDGVKRNLSIDRLSKSYSVVVAAAAAAAAAAS